MLILFATNASGAACAAHSNPSFNWKLINTDNEEISVRVGDTPDRYSCLVSCEFSVAPETIPCVSSKCDGNCATSGKDDSCPRVDGDKCRGKPLNCYHSECTSMLDSRSPACMAAMHRFCYINGKGSAAYPQEVGTHQFGLLCAKATWYGDVAYSDIPNCAGGGQNTQTAACYSSARRYCDTIGHSGAGIIQELGKGVAGLACVPTPWYHVVKIAELSKLHTGCDSPAKAQNPPCLAAAHRYCSSNGLGHGGVISELGQDEVALGCITEAVYMAAKV